MKYRNDYPKEEENWTEHLMHQAGLGKEELDELLTYKYKDGKLNPKTSLKPEKTPPSVGATPLKNDKGQYDNWSSIPDNNLPDPAFEVRDPIPGEKYPWMSIPIYPDPFNWGNEAPSVPDRKKTASDGLSTDYYALPEHATELRHLISHKGMSKSRGDIFKACYRLGEKDGTAIEYDLNKMKFFIDDLIEMNKRGEML